MPASCADPVGPYLARIQQEAHKIVDSALNASN